MEDRMAQELELLRKHYPRLQTNGQWILIPDYPLGPGWNATSVDVATRIEHPLPGTPPYGIYVRSGVRFEGKLPQNYTEPSQTQVPFHGDWGFFSWSPEQWQPLIHITQGANYLKWVIGFRSRFMEGV